MTEVLIYTATVSFPLLFIPTLLLIYALSSSDEAFRSDLPQDIQDAMPESTPEDRIRGLTYGAIYLISLLATLVFIAWNYLHTHDGGFTRAFQITLLADIVFLLMDLVIIDWLILCTLRLRWIIPCGTEHCAGWRNYGFHLKAALQTKALSANITLAFLTAALAWTISLVT